MYAIDPNHPDVIILREHARLVKFKKGETILHAFDVPQHLYAIRTGLVKVYTLNAQAEENITVIYGPDELFPLAWIINQKSQNVCFEALTNCEISLVPQDIFLENVKKSAALSFALSQKILEQFMLYASRINNLEFKYGRERLAYSLLLLAAKFGARVDGTFILPRIGQQDLGATINMSRESVSRELSRLERLGIVAYNSSSIVIKNPDKLRKELGKDVSIMFFDTLDTQA